MNILIIGTGAIEQKLIDLCLKSRFLDHIYTASNEPLDDIPNIEYSTYDELCRKAKVLQIDIILLSNKELIQDGIVEFFKKNMLNVVSVNKKWLHLESSRLIAKQLISHYSINYPEIILAPVTFPVVIKTDKPCLTKVANSMQELIEIKETIAEEKTFLEEFLHGDVYYLMSAWDGKTLFHFPLNNLTEVQTDRLELYKTKLNFMFSDEKADFNGFFVSKLIWAKNDWYVLEYIMHFNEEIYDITIEKDFLYLLNSITYQKLNEF